MKKILILLCTLILITSCGGGGGSSNVISDTNEVIYRNYNSTPYTNTTAIENNNDYKNNNGLDNIKTAAAWKNIYGSPSSSNGLSLNSNTASIPKTTVAVMDSGVDTNHPDLVNNIVQGYDFYNKDSNPNPGDSYLNNDHGTHVAGIVAASFADGGIAGVAPEAYIMPLKMTDNPGEIFGGSLVSNAANYAKDNDAFVINNSWGEVSIKHYFTEGTQTFYHYGPLTSTYSAINNANDFKNFINNGENVVIFASGNDGLNSETGKVNVYKGLDDLVYVTSTILNLPSMISRAPKYANYSINSWLTVAAVDESNKIADFSNGCGEAKNFCVVAPGVNIVSNVPTNSNSDYATASLTGTSMAAPFVSGAAALLKQGFPNLNGAQIVDLLTSTATDLGEAGVDEVYGHGIINLEKASTAQGVTTIANTDVENSIYTTANSYLTPGKIFGNKIDASNVYIGYLDKYQRSFYTTMNNFIATKEDYEYKFNFITPPHKSTIINNFNGVELIAINFKGKPVISFKRNNFSYTINAKKNNLYKKYDFINNNSQTDYFIDLLSNNFKLFNYKFDDFYSNYVDDTFNNTKLFQIGIDKKFGFVNVNIENSILKENSAFLGTKVYGAFEQGLKTKSNKLAFNSSIYISSNINLNFDYSKAISAVKTNNYNPIQNFRFESQSLKLGMLCNECINKNEYFALNFIKSPKVTSGLMPINTIIGYDINGDYNESEQLLDLSPEAQENILEFRYQKNISKNIIFQSALQAIDNAGHQQDKKGSAFYLKTVWSF